MLRELLDAPTEIDDVEIDDTFEPQDELALRSVMIRLAQLERDAAETKRLRDRVKEEYDRKIAALDEQAAWLRRSVQAYVERHGKTSFPDVGTAYLQNGGPKIRIVDRDAFRDATADVFVKQTWDETWAKAYALERALEDGELMPGVELVPGGPDLRIRKA